MSSFLPSIEEIEELIKNEPASVRVSSTRSGGGFKRTKEGLLHDIDKEKFLENVDWNDLEIDEKVMVPVVDKNKEKFDRLHEVVTAEEYVELVDVHALFVARCIPKPFKSVSNRSNYNGWEISAMPTSGDINLTTLNVGKHVVANSVKDSEGIYFTIYVNEDDLEKIYGVNFARLKSLYDSVEFGPVESTKKGEDLKLFWLSFSIKDFHSEINNKELIMAIRKVTTHLITESKTVWAKHQCESFVQDVLEKVQNICLKK